MRRGEFGDCKALPPIGTQSPGNSPPSAPIFDATHVRDKAMEDYYGKISRGALARADGLSDRAIFWGLISTVIIVAVVMLRSMHW